MTSIPGFQTFRSKEIWLCGFTALLCNPYTFGLHEATVHTIWEEMLSVGDLGPGPWRLLRWCVGICATKGLFQFSMLALFPKQA
jgi:hypothetical protein